MWLRLSDAGGAVSIPGQCDPWPKEKKTISSVSRYSTTKGRSRNKRQEGMKDERQRVQGGTEERMHRSAGEGAISNEGL